MFYMHRSGAEDMKGFSGEPKLGICLRDVYVKGKFDVLNIAFTTAQDKAMFAKHVGGQLQKLAAQVISPTAEPF